MNKKKTALWIVCVLATAIACKNKYLVGGDVEDINRYKGMTNYDVLATNPMFDTLVQLIDAAGLKDAINKGNTTFFAPTDRAILTYLEQRTVFVQQTYNQTAIFGLDSLKYYLKTNKDHTKDSLLMYQINVALDYPDLTRAGIAYQTSLALDTAIISYSPNGSRGPVSTVPRSVYYTHLWKHYDLSDANPAEAIPEDVGVRTLIITSCILTKSGYLNYLDNNTILFFYDTKI